MTDALALYRFAMATGLIAAGAPLSIKALSGRHGVRERLGLVDDSSSRDPRPAVWFHAASVGETKVVSALVAALRSIADVRVVASTVTATGRARGRDVLPDAQAILAPIDSPPFVRGAFRRIRPSLVVIVETELWPEMIATAIERRVPVAVANARMSERSFRRYRAARALFSPLLSRVAVVAAQTGLDAARYRALGVPAASVGVVGNVKADEVVSAPAVSRARAREKLGLPPDGRVIVCGSTRPGEEAVVLEAFSQVGDLAATLVIAPRHVDRASEVQALSLIRGFRVKSRSRGETASRGEVFLLDTMGELREAYAGADVAFVGGTFAPIGGHDPLEPSACGVPTAVGPHVGKIRDAVDSLVSLGGGRMVANASQLAEWWRLMLVDELARSSAGARARAAAESLTGASAKTAKMLAGLLS